MLDREQTRAIDGAVGSIEVRVQAAKAVGKLQPSSAVAVVCHPHPQHGGTMDNKVVHTLMRTYRDLGCDVVCFNFRGVGASEGEYDEARGEQDDLRCVLAWVREQWPNSPLLLAGFSFGSYVAAQVSLIDGALAHLALIAPPVDKYGFQAVDEFLRPLTVVNAGADELLDSHEIQRWVESANKPLDLLHMDGASHFFHGRLTDLKKLLEVSILASNTIKV